MPASGGPALVVTHLLNALLLTPPLPWPRTPDRRLRGACRDTPPRPRRGPLSSSLELKRLQLKNHRNYPHLDLVPGSGVNVFIGPNGQGKTNLLEAVAMLALSSSPRARREYELVGPVGPGSRIEAQVETEGTVRELSIAVEVEGERARRTIEVDGARRRAFDLPGNFRVVLFWPDDLGLVKGGPELRRRFLNQMLGQVEPGYARAIAGLRRVLEQRNSLLKRIASGEGGGDMLDAWNQEFVRVGTGMVRARSRARGEMAPEGPLCHDQVAAGDRLQIDYEATPEN